MFIYLEEGRTGAKRLTNINCLKFEQSKAHLSSLKTLNKYIVKENVDVQYLIIFTSKNINSYGNIPIVLLKIIDIFKIILHMIETSMYQPGQKHINV